MISPDYLEEIRQQVFGVLLTRGNPPKPYNTKKIYILNKYTDSTIYLPVGRRTKFGRYYCVTSRGEVLRLRFLESTTEQNLEEVLRALAQSLADLCFITLEEQRLLHSELSEVSRIFRNGMQRLVDWERSHVLQERGVTPQ